MGNTVVVDRLKKCWSYESAKSGEQVRACNLDLKDEVTGSKINVTLKVNSAERGFSMESFGKLKCDPRKDSKCVLRLGDLF